MFRKIRNWLNGETIAAELIGSIGGVVGGRFGIGKNRGFDKVVEKIVTHFDGDPDNNVKLY